MLGKINQLSNFFICAMKIMWRRLIVLVAGRVQCGCNQEFNKLPTVALDELPFQGCPLQDHIDMLTTELLFPWPGIRSGKSHPTPSLSCWCW